MRALLTLACFVTTARAAAAPSRDWFDPDLQIYQALVQIHTDHPLEYAARKVEVVDPAGKLDAARRAAIAHDIANSGIELGGSDLLGFCTDIVVGGGNWNGAVDIAFGVRRDKPTNIKVTASPRAAAFETCLANKLRSATLVYAVDQPITVKLRYMFAPNYSPQG